MATKPRHAVNELVPNDPVSPVRVTHCQEPRFGHAWHKHPEIEIKWILRGRGVCHIGDSIGTFEPGDVYVVGSDTPHCWRSDVVSGEWVRAHLVQFRTSVFGSEFLSQPAAEPIARLLERARLGLQIRGAEPSRVKTGIQALYACQTPLARLAALLALLSELTETDSRTLSVSDARAPEIESRAPRVRQVMDIVRARSSEALTEQAIAKDVGLSAAGFSRFFRRHFGKPFVAYLAAVRVAQACQRLLEQEDSIAEIAASVGFGNLASFNRRFREIKGTTPSAYRRTARKLAPR